MADSDQPLIIATDCAPACDPAALSVTVKYPAETFSPLDTIELLQYRIDYAMDPALGTVPYFADELGFELKPGDSKTLKLVAAGGAQRQFVERVLDAGSAAGEATVSLAGYDWDNHQVIVSGRFAIRFEDTTEGSQSRDGGTGE